MPQASTRHRTPAHRYARGGGLLLLALGAVSIPSALDAGHGWNVAVLVASGALGLAAAGRWERDFALGFGLLFAALGIWGLAAGSGSELFSGFAATTFGSLFDLAFGLVGLGAGAATPAAPSSSGRSAAPRRRARAGRLAGGGGEARTGAASRRRPRPRPSR